MVCQTAIPEQYNRIGRSEYNVSNVWETEYIRIRWVNRIKSIRVANQNVLLSANNNILYGELVPGHVRDVTQANTNEHTVQCESKKIPPEIFWHFFPKGWEFLIQILHAYNYTFLSTLE